MFLRRESIRTLPVKIYREDYDEHKDNEGDDASDYSYIPSWNKYDKFITDAGGETIWDV